LFVCPFEQPIKSELVKNDIRIENFIKIAANERGLAQWRYSVIRQPGAAAPD
jgi:hypothetical protein